MNKFARIGAKWLRSGVALSLALSIQLGFGGALPSTYAEGPSDPAPYIAAKVVNENAGKKVLFDNTHGQTAGAADWVIDGGFSDFGNALANNGYDVKELRKASSFTYSDLSSYSVFIVAEPNIPFKQSEQAAMERYVKEGGSIFFIGDHYNADRNKNRWDGSESINGYRRGAWVDPAKGMSTEERNSAAMQDVVSSDWLGSNFGIRFRYNALGDITANGIVASNQAFGITDGVSKVAMHAGSTLAITDPTKAKGIVYLPKTTAAWGNAVDQGVYNGGGIAEGPYAAVSKVGLGKAAFIGDSSPVEDASPKYVREETGTSKTTYDGFKEQDDATLLVNMVNWLSKQENYTSLDQVPNLQLDEKTTLLPFEAPEASTEPQSEPWSTPAAGYKWWDQSTFKAGSYGGATASANASYSFVHQATLPNAQDFQIRVVVDNLPANSTVSGFSTGIYLTSGGTQIAKIQNQDGTWPAAYGYGNFSVTSNSQGRAYKDLTVRVKPSTTGAANLRLRLNGNNLITNSVTLANVPAEPLPAEGNPTPTLITIAEGRSKAEGTVVTFQGTITTEPGAFGGQSFYLQDATGGIYVFQSTSGFHQGDVVKITAPLALYNAELELTNPVSIEKTGVAQLPTAKQATTVNDGNQGQIIELRDVTIRNIIEAVPTGSFEFDAVSGNVSNHVRVDVRTGLQLEGFPYQEGQVVNLSGVSSIFKGVYQLKVRGLSDISLIPVTVPPVTTATLSAAANNSGWFNQAVNLTLTATDQGSGKVTTKYAINDGPEVTYAGPVTIDSEGVNVVRYFSVSAAGNIEATKSIEVKLDKTAPIVTLTQSGKAVGDVLEQDVLKFELVSTDTGSGIATQNLSVDGQEIAIGQPINAKDLGVGDHNVQYTVVDVAGNVSKNSTPFRVGQLLAQGAPGKPVLSDNNGYDTGIRDGNYTISMNMWWGNNGSEFKLYEDGVLIATRQLTDSSPTAQALTIDITGKANGTYTYTSELINSQGATASNPLIVVVTNAGPGKPVLSQDNWDGDGNYNISMNMWWGTNGSEYRLYENGQLVDTQNLAEITPNAQRAVTGLKDRAVGTYEYRAELINAAGVSSSEIITVRVVK
ncbi:DNA/RNA endonuclease YhcR with UshA esterase domain [Paenibacillus anaericanus]|uniref:OmpL47-type beta-barrel domain-containing protein n=1 Tax=Paenibacillus anaericanus TaxID=170367 RepID=UPI00277FE3D1|nr:chitinase N-terminal domain-containing protein [Paenibacillus anaericanus]MDQ0087543.1 DNA/RNA endonuclease YhcR with UshA esterase domain [Paenibacillus anaericanus]